MASVRYIYCKICDNSYRAYTAIICDNTNPMVCVANTITCNWTRSTNSLSKSYPHNLFIKFILILFSRQPCPYRYFKSPFPDIVALPSVKQTCELHLSNDCKQAGILIVISRPVVFISSEILFYFNLFAVI